MPYSLGTYLSMALLCLPMISEATQNKDLRGSRHCEIIMSKTRLNFSVYSTVGLNDCPNDQWKKITVAGIKNQTGAFFVHLNGPRYWLVDDYEQSTSTRAEERQLGGLPMRETGVLHLTLLDMIRGADPYREHKVERQTTWIYKAGHSVYELIDPKGRIFVMQSYSTEKSPLTEAILSGLDVKLKLPAGWHFRTQVLTKNAYVTSLNNRSVVIQDGLLNTYQLATDIL